MTKIVSIREAKTNLYKLLQRVAKGDQIVIGRAGAPIAKLVPYRRPLRGRRPGIWKGKMVIAKDFDRLPREVERAFRGSKG
jgi:prevent-host-death family protein